MYSNELNQLPIFSIKSDLTECLKKSAQLVIKAEPGAGKTTLIPLFILELVSHKIIMLEPRRLAAKNAAKRMAEILSEPVGETVGYRIRHETKISKNTKIEVITEGVLTRMIQSDPELTGISCIIFDEFHERNINSDLGLAMSIEVQENLREDLKLVIMSATLDHNVLQSVLPKSNFLYCHGRQHPVAINYLPPKIAKIAVQSGAQARLNLWEQGIVWALNDFLSNPAFYGKDVLCFLPGLQEIKKAETIIKNNISRVTPLSIAVLHGSLPWQKQQSVLYNKSGNQRVILSTNIAETSVTIENIGGVIDSGLDRFAEFDPNVAFQRLITTRVSADSATQRAGRAGRLSDGVCYRLWSESEDLSASTKPEIKRLDLSAFLLEIKNWGIENLEDLALLDLPPQGNLVQAESFLAEIHALNEAKKITRYGKSILRFGTHPRTAHLLLLGEKLNLEALASVVCVLLEEKDLLSEQQLVSIDFESRIEQLISLLDISPMSRETLNKKQGSLDKNQPLVDKKISKKSSKRSLDIRLANIFNQIQKYYQHLTANSACNSKLSVSKLIGLLRTQISDLPRLLISAFPDRVAQLRGQHYLLANGGGVYLHSDCVETSKYLLVLNIVGRKERPLIQYALGITEPEIRQCLNESIVTQTQVQWNAATQSVSVLAHEKLLDLTLSTLPSVSIPEQQVVAKLCDGIAELGLSCLPWTEDLRQWLARVLMAEKNELIDFKSFSFDTSYLLSHLSEWLMPFISGISKVSEITCDILSHSLKSQLDWDQQVILNELLPEKISIPSGRQAKIDYTLGPKPVLAVKLQEMFGLLQTPKIARNTINLSIHLLSPAGRPLQITEDLLSFWEGSYLEVKKEMKGKYPKHPWPDDPKRATATLLTKKKLNK